MTEPRPTTEQYAKWSPSSEQFEGVVDEIFDAGVTAGRATDTRSPWPAIWALVREQEHAHPEQAGFCIPMTDSGLVRPADVLVTDLDRAAHVAADHHAALRDALGREPETQHHVYVLVRIPDDQLPTIDPDGLRAYRRATSLPLLGRPVDATPDREDRS